MKKEIIYMVGLFVAMFLFGIIGWEGSRSKYENIVKMYDHNGIIGHDIKVWSDTVTVTSALQNIDISSAGFTHIMAVDAVPEFNSVNPIAIPIAAIKSYTTTSILVNLLQSNSQTVVLAGTMNGLQLLQAFSSTRLHIRVIGY